MYFTSGCSSDAGAEINQDSMTVSEIKFQEYSGFQDDIFHQRIEIINSDDTYNNLWSLLPSITEIPQFSESDETLITILAPSDPCSFIPKLKSVIENNKTITVSVSHEPLPSPETCNPSPDPTYGYNLIKIKKTSKLINVVFDI